VRFTEIIHGREHRTGEDPADHHIRRLLDSILFYLIAQSSGTFDLELPREAGVVDREASGQYLQGCAITSRVLCA
jgi:hypothetical protein